MRRRLTPPFLLPAVVVFAIIFSVSVYVAQRFESRATVVLAPQLSVSKVPSLSAHQFLVFDVHTGAVVASRDADMVVPIASVTKLFAAANMLTGYDLQATTSVTWSDLSGDGAAGKLAFGQIYSYRDILFPLLLESSNDAAKVLERITDGGVVTSMNTWAQEVGANNTKFVDASGIGDGNVSTAVDLKLLATDVFKKHPHAFDITSLPQYIGPYTGWLNNNPVAGEAGFRGGKHGYTTAANRTLVAVFNESINGHSYTLGYIILGSDDLATDFATLRTFINNSASQR
jgi:D-alanyl-D-alanine carboxypeptidase